jgi:hypothetical protein
MRRLLFPVVIAAAACDGAPAPTPARPPVSYVIDALVTEALAPLAAVPGARVELTDGPHSGASCLTDAQGRCRINVALTGPSPTIRFSKEGFHSATRQFQNGGNPYTGVLDAWFMVARDSTPNMYGDYDVTVTASSSCAGLSPQHRSFSTRAFVSHPNNPTLVLLELAAPARCNYLFGVIQPNGDVSLGHDSECDFRAPPGPVTIAETPNRVTAEGSWNGRVVDRDFTLTLAGTMEISVPGMPESCSAPDHRWDFHRR